MKFAKRPFIRRAHSSRVSLFDNRVKMVLVPTQGERERERGKCHRKRTYRGGRVLEARECVRIHAFARARACIRPNLPCIRTCNGRRAAPRNLLRLARARVCTFSRCVIFFGRIVRGCSLKYTAPIAVNAVGEFFRARVQGRLDARTFFLPDLVQLSLTKRTKPLLFRIADRRRSIDPREQFNRIGRSVRRFSAASAEKQSICGSRASKRRSLRVSLDARSELYRKSRTKSRVRVAG